MFFYDGYALRYSRIYCTYPRKVARNSQNILCHFWSIGSSPELGHFACSQLDNDLEVYQPQLKVTKFLQLQLPVYNPLSWKSQSFSLQQMEDRVCWNWGLFWYDHFSFCRRWTFCFELIMFLFARHKLGREYHSTSIRKLIPIHLDFDKESNHLFLSGFIFS